MKKKEKMSPHIIAVTAFAAFIVLGLACATTDKKASEAVKSAASIDELAGLNDKLAWLELNAESGSSYVIEINSNETIQHSLLAYGGNLSYKNKSGITITIKGDDVNRTINANMPGRIFYVGQGVTLILEDNITLQGYPYNQPRSIYFALVIVNSGGTLVMNEGATITGGTNNYSEGGGVAVSDGGTFLMNGGTISGNLCLVGPIKIEHVQLGAATRAATSSAMARGANRSGIRGASNLNTAPAAPAMPVAKGGGVYVSGRGTFTKTGGTITGFASDQTSGNVVRDYNGNIMQGNGHAVYVDGAQVKRKETTAGPDVNLYYSNGQFSGAWDY